MSAKREGKREMVEHFSHQHLLESSWRRNKYDTARCSGCWKEVRDLGYCCPEFECKFYLHKTCAKLAPKINHPFHPPHPLILLAKAPYVRCFCNFCGWLCMGFVYRCAACEFHLDVNCANLQVSVAGNFEKLEHFSHEHPLIFNEKYNKKVYGDCQGCRKPLSGPIYRCLDCSKFDLHKECAELPLELNHPFHPSHPLILLPISPNFPSTVRICNFCHSICAAFVYHCSSCNFYLDTGCALLKQFLAGKFLKLEYFCHKHPLTFFEMHKNEIKDPCSACGKLLSGPIYSCIDCGFHLHKTCAQLPLKFGHPFHCFCEDLLVLQAEWLNPSQATCSFCNSGLRGLIYHCVSCKFNLHITCALLLPLNTEKTLVIQHFSHVHQLIFVEKHGDEVNGSCRGCGKVLSGPIYSCVECKFHLHKKCAQLPREIDHSSHRKHSLVLLAEPPSHQKGCSCYLCKKQCKGFVYYCSDCDFGNLLEDVEDVSLPRDIKVETHEHPFKLLLRPISFTCDFCGINGDRTPYVCSECDLVIHKNCIRLPSAVKIMRHPHRITFQHFLRQKKSNKRMCNICQEEVNTEYGSYYCYICHQYIAHVGCATDDYIWDETNPDDEDQRSKGALSLITSVIEEVRHGEDVIAAVIKHAFHQHILILTLGGEVKDDRSCNGCMRPLSTPFFSCEQCQFFLHKKCVELPSVKQHPLHRHPLVLYKPNNAEYPRTCSACLQLHHGFTYNCEKCNFHIDIDCSLLSDTLKHESHGAHHLYLDHRYEGNCSASGEHITFRTGAYRCKHCESFALSFKCIKLPRTASYKYDKHLLTLTYFDRVDPNQCYCDICEEERDPKYWFYHCAYCDTSVHPQCVLGELPYIKLGSIYIHHVHPHRLTFVRKIWDCPPCSICGELCINQALECTKLGCNFIIHWKCKNSSQASIPKKISYRTTQLDDEDQRLNVNEEIRFEEDGIVTSIKLPVHEHFLILGDEVKVDNICDACMKPVSAPFYGCERCLFFLHKNCAELPRQKRHPFHRHQLTLKESDPAVVDDVSTCSACLRSHHGFAYVCNRCEFQIDIQCSLLSDTLRHPSHEHLLLFHPNYTGHCSACSSNIYDKGVYRCGSGCEFVLDFRCSTEPPKVKSKFHEHPVNLIYHDDSDQHYCGICEEKRHPKHWFYHCADCYNSFHPECVLGELPYIKLGSTYNYFGHRHFLTFVEKMNNSLPCNICRKLCNNQALECKKSECGFIIHCKCRGQGWQTVRPTKRRS
ncbi:PREDICTED: uncharacterized protein LOC18599046 [Theobroma cacao]|uniref:Uncharacterized protein LOC18599046 n=1 Tax=Theobroma cacao TaxID=3641 RepID=A0AB32WCR3_THECC|nr:PREDICTED: uncharacterized protein LOC18599046 [Theobroma cacao]